MIKVLRNAEHLEMGAMVGIDPESDGLARAARMGVPTTHEGVDGLMALPDFAEIEIIFDATSAKAHEANAAQLAPLGKRLIDLTPAAIGPYVIPAVNLEEHLDALNVNMVTCGGQATIPVVAAVARVVPCSTPRSSPPSPASRPAPAPAPTSTSSPRRPRPPSPRSAAPNTAKRSSSSTPPSRR